MSHTADFFEELSRRGHEPLLQRVQATIRFEVTDDGDADGSDAGGSAGSGGSGDGHDGPGGATTVRLVTVDHGDLRILTDRAGAGATADATIGCSASELDALVSGRTSAMASLLRGALTVQGDPELVVLAQRLFSRHPVSASGTGLPVEEGRPS